jgi:'Cold-shock' DNA-binding domain
MTQGTVKWFNEDKGVGFIAPDGAHSSFWRPTGTERRRNAEVLNTEKRSGATALGFVFRSAPDARRVAVIGGTSRATI